MRAAVRGSYGVAREGVCLGAIPAAARCGEADAGALTGGNREAWYAALCRHAALDPAERPFALVRVDGRLVPVAVGGATARMAARRGVTVEVLGDPTVLRLCGATLVKAVCRARLPDGRSETVTATVPWAHPTGSVERAVARARARATLSLLGIAALDESELEGAAAREQDSHRAPGIAARRQA